MEAVDLWSFGALVDALDLVDVWRCVSPECVEALDV